MLSPFVLLSTVPDCEERLLMQKLCRGANLDIFRKLLDSFCSSFQLILRYENLGFSPTGPDLLHHLLLQILHLSLDLLEVFLRCSQTLW